MGKGASTGGKTPRPEDWRTGRFSLSHPPYQGRNDLSEQDGSSRLSVRRPVFPLADVRGNITSHRARSTIASQLYNAREPMTLFELQQWLGHSTPTATQHYAKITPLKVAKSLCRCRVLRPQSSCYRSSGRSGHGAKWRATTEPWKFYDLGHGYCTYDFFEQCQHRMACAKCDFYMRRNPRRRCCLMARRICCDCFRRSRLAKQNRRPLKMVSQPTKICCRNWRTCPLRQGQLRISISAELVQITSVRQIVMPVAQDGGPKVYR